MHTFLTRFSAALFLITAAAAHAADLKLEAKLVWGANDDKCDATCKAVDNDLACKLNAMFKWKHYYEITNRTASIALNRACDLKMSDRCTLQIKNLGDSRIEINCIGQGKRVSKGAYTLVPPKWLVLGGNATNDTAWFIGLRAIDPKAAEAKKSLSRN
jgi:hypothetical protein